MITITVTIPAPTKCGAMPKAPCRNAAPNTNCARMAIVVQNAKARAARRPFLVLREVPLPPGTQIKR